MTVAELIALLQTHPPTMRVVVDGYEDGFCDVFPASLSVQPIYLGEGRADSEGGPHWSESDASIFGDDAEKVDALVIRRFNVDPAL